MHIHVSDYPRFELNPCQRGCNKYKPCFTNSMC